jgi:hypothetical protein
LIIQGQWFPFLSDTEGKDYLLHGLDLDVTIGGIYLTDELFEIENIDELVRYINNESFINLDLSKKLFKKDIYKKYSDLVSSSVEGSILECHEETLQETYDHFILMNSMNRVILQRYRAIRNKIETYSPMYDNDLIDYYAKIPIEERKNYKLFHPFMINVCGEASNIKYQRTNLPAVTPVEFWKLSQTNERQREELYRDVARDTEGEVYIPYDGYYTNVDEWLRFNETWKQATFELLQSEDSIVRSEWLNTDYLDDIINEHQGHSANHMATLMRMMSAEVFLRISDGKSAREISESILR